MDIVTFLILALAAWRISSLLVDEPGPFDVFEKVRNVVGVKYDAKNETYATNEIAKQFMCVWCMTLYVGVVVVLLYLTWNNAVYLFLPFAMSGIGMLADKQLWRGWKRGH